VARRDPLEPLLALDGVADGVAAVRTAVDQALAQPVLRRRSAEVSAESVLRGAWAAAQLSGSPATLDDVRAGAPSDQVARGALRAYADLGNLTEAWTRAPRQVLARLHVLAARDLVDEAALGRPVRGADRLDVLSDVLAATRAPAVVVAAVVLGEISALDPFPPSSPIVGWAAVRLTFVTRGLDPKSLVVPEVGAVAHDAPLEDYRAGDVAAWLGYVSRAVVDGARETRAICQALQRGEGSW
jgi:hypothetical protein